MSNRHVLDALTAQDEVMRLYGSKPVQVKMHPYMRDKLAAEMGLRLPLEHLYLGGSFVEVVIDPMMQLGEMFLYTEDTVGFMNQDVTPPLLQLGPEDYCYALEV
jgi:hypothetical protein